VGGFVGACLFARLVHDSCCVVVGGGSLFGGCVGGGNMCRGLGGGWVLLLGSDSRNMSHGSLVFGGSSGVLLLRVGRLIIKFAGHVTGFGCVVISGASWAWYVVGGWYRRCVACMVGLWCRLHSWYVEVVVFLHVWLLQGCRLSFHLLGGGLMMGRVSVLEYFGGLGRVGEGVLTMSVCGLRVWFVEVSVIHV
jgi:hypothetical protein